jgi:hypothetical protein
MHIPSLRQPGDPDFRTRGFASPDHSGFALSEYFFQLNCLHGNHLTKNSGETQASFELILFKYFTLTPDFSFRK